MPSVIKLYPIIRVLIILAVGAMTTYVYCNIYGHFKGKCANASAKFNEVETFLLFVGYPRSRHTLLSSLLDAHPHIVVANEANVVVRLKHGNLNSTPRAGLFDELVQSSFDYLKSGEKGMVMNETVQNTNHFGFFVKRYWQGTYDRYIKVIGDKAAHFTSALFQTMTAKDIKALIEELEKKVKAKVKIIHLTRNPFDIISTTVLRKTKAQPGRFGKQTAKVNEPSLLEEAITIFFKWAEGSSKAREVLRDDLLDIVGMHLVRKPVETLKTICHFLQITCSDDYLDACANVVDPGPSRTRKRVVWTEENIDWVYSITRKYSFLMDYNFNN